MGKVLLEMTMSVDGYTAGPDISEEDPLGRNGEQLHDWMFAGRSGEEVERFQAEKFAAVGAVIVGRRMADLGIPHWGEEPAFGAPCFVVTHRPAEKIVKKGGTSYVFVTDGIDAAMGRARGAAGEQDVMVAGGADIARQYLNAGMVDEISLHLSPMVLGGGTALFDGVRPDVRLVPAGATSSPLAVHLTYEVEARPDRT
jgi:dihydrofolate reductase